MSDIPPINGTGSIVRAVPARQGQRDIGAEASVTVMDRVEISEMARLLSTLERGGDIRVDKVLAIREAIADGTYETDDKIAVTVDRLIEVLRMPGLS